MNDALVYVIGIFLYSLLSAYSLLCFLTFSLVFPVAVYSPPSFPLLSKESCFCQSLTQQLYLMLKDQY